MILQSPSGYCMPFEEEKNKEGNLIKRLRGTERCRHRRDILSSRHKLPCQSPSFGGSGSGVVSSIGTDKEHGVYIVIRYGKYEVTYAHLANIFIRFGQKVKKQVRR